MLCSKLSVLYTLSDDCRSGKNCSVAGAISTLQSSLRTRQFTSGTHPEYIPSGVREVYGKWKTGLAARSEGGKKEPRGLRGSSGLPDPMRSAQKV